MKNIMFIDDSLTVHTSTRNAVADLDLIDLSSSRMDSRIRKVNADIHAEEINLAETEQKLKTFKGLDKLKKQMALVEKLDDTIADKENLSPTPD